MRPRSLQSVLLAPALLICMATAQAQSTPTFGAFQFSNGVHPTIDATFEQGEPRAVERFWRDELKSISTKVSNKKELTGEAARIPSASPDTLRIMVGVEKPKGTLFTTVHIAFLTTAGYVGPDSPDRERLGCSEWVQQRTLVLLRRMAQAEVDHQQKKLDNLNRDLDMLRREHQRAEDNIRRTQQRMKQAGKDSTAAAESLAALEAGPPVGNDSTAAAASDKARAKERSKLQAQAQRAAYNRAGARKKISDLQWDLKKNADDQQAKQSAIEKQQGDVKAAQDKLQSIR